MENEVIYKQCNYTAHSHLKQNHSGYCFSQWTGLDQKTSLLKWIKVFVEAATRGAL